MALSPEALAKLKIAKASMKLSKNSKQGNVISKGDFALRLDDNRTVPCHCLPATDIASGLPVRPPRVRGGDNWLMYCGNVRLLASVKPDVKPEALVWGGTYEAKMPSSTAEPGKQPAMAAVAQATPPSKAASAPAAAPPKAAPSSPKAAVARETDTARRERIARRMAVLNNGVLRDLAAKYPQLASMNIGPQLADTNEFWNDKDEFNQAAFETFIKRMMGGK
jgi:pyruvate/2-oxoglutarate dehydrogenase complex dihydrolipoamide acyltransferase (E2) component